MMSLYMDLPRHFNVIPTACWRSRRLYARFPGRSTSGVQERQVYEQLSQNIAIRYLGKTQRCDGELKLCWISLNKE